MEDKNFGLIDLLMPALSVTVLKLLYLIIDLLLCIRRFVSELQIYSNSLSSELYSGFKIFDFVQRHQVIL